MCYTMRYRLYAAGLSFVDFLHTLFNMAPAPTDGLTFYLGIIIYVCTLHHLSVSVSVSAMLVAAAGSPRALRAINPSRDNLLENTAAVLAVLLVVVVPAVSVGLAGLWLAAGRHRLCHQ
eukprot:COSAG06_NODE_32273_length_508_cov_28.304778_2_plen_119_part_00